jgi:tetratricopeptide (TPR) repeat protein
MKLTQIANSRKFQSFLRVATFGIVIPVMALEFTLVMFTVRGHQLYSEEKYQEAETFYRLAIPFNLISDHPYRYLGQALREQKKYSEAIAIFQELLERNPKDSYTYTALAYTFQKQQNYKKAISAFQKVIEIDPSNAQNYIALARSFEGAGRYDKAVAAYQKAIQKKPDDALSYIALGFLLFFNQQKYEEGIAAYRKAVELTPKDAELYKYLSSALQLRGKYDEALSIIQKAIALAPKDADAYGSLGSILAMKGQTNEAIAAYHKAIELNPKDASAYGGLGRQLEKQKKYQEEIAAYQKAVDLEPSDFMNYYSLGYALNTAGKLDEASIAYRKAIKLNPKNTTVKTSPHTLLAQVLVKQGKINEAIATYRQAIQYNPKDEEPYKALGELLLKQGNKAEAAKAYTQAGRLLSGFDAIWLVAQAVQLSPEDVEAYQVLGDLWYTNHQYSTAIAAYRKAIQLSPKSADVYVSLAKALKQQGNLEAAIGQLKQANKIDQNNSFHHFLNEWHRLLALQKKPQLANQPEHLPNLNKRPLLPVLRAVVQIHATDSQGSSSGTGWIIKREQNKAFILTNRHVVTKNDEKTPQPNLEVEFYSEPLPGQFRLRRPAKILNITTPDEPLDLAVVEVTEVPKDIQALAVNTQPPIPGSSVQIIGHPFNSYSWMVKQGKVSTSNETFTNNEIRIVISAASGNSGGPVLDQHNRVVGIGYSGREKSHYRAGSIFDRWNAERMDAVMLQLQKWNLF